ncbi:MAG TPA: thioredoxin fold domain-containing protein [Candidatus Polarisedimenticolaceae bacterium]|nr:thioredoxin fold domain-containing protein [Candidatus Polarisedimenticolaceae bacterium]
MDAEVYPSSPIQRYVQEHFVPVRVHVKEQPEPFRTLGDRYDAHWTPTTLVLDDAGEERHRIEGFLPGDDFLAQLALGVAKAAFSHGQFEEAEEGFQNVVTRHHDTDAAAEAQYWAGVARYKATGDAKALADTARSFRDRYAGTSWAKKASVWG